MDHQEQKKSKKGKIIAVIVIVVVILAAIGCWFTGIVGGISEAEAKDIAYQQVPGANGAAQAMVTKDFDDFSMEYEVQFSYENVLYEFKILARNGKIVSQDMERIGGQVQEQASQQSQTNPTDQTNQANQASQQDIGIEKAKEIALAQVSGAAVSNITKASADQEQGKLIYEIEIVYNQQEYDFDIDAATGEIIGHSTESVFN